MQYSTSVVKTRDGADIYLHQWIPEHPDKLMLIVHGAVEHAYRYDYFARKLNKEGFAVFAPDHRGHGLTAKASGVFSHFGDEDGFLKVVDDLGEILDDVEKRFPGFPKAIFGHSLGSFLTRKFISMRGEEFKAAVISGTTWGNTLELKGGLVLAKLWSLFADKNKPNKSFDNFLWTQLNNKVKNRKGPRDFINSDEKEVEKYLEDPLNGNPITIEFGVQMSVGILQDREMEVFYHTPKDLAIYLISGMDDPLSNQGKDIDLIARKYRDAGVQSVTEKLYEGARHEVINEPNKDEVIAGIINWLKEHF